MLTRAPDECTNQARHDHDLVNQDHPQQSRSRHGGGEEQIEKQKRRGDEPVDVANVVDLAVNPSNLRVATDELDIDWRPAQMRSHCEVRDSGDHGDGGSDVVEDAMCAWLHQGEGDEGDGSASHHRSDSPVPVGAMSCEGDLSCLPILGG